MSRRDPFKHIGPPSSWGEFGTGGHDLECDAERRAMCDFFLRRMAKGERVGNEQINMDLLAGGMVAFAGLFIAMVGEENVTDEVFDRFMSIAAFSWVQARSCFENARTVQ